MNNEAQIRARVADWERAVREKNYGGILAWHHAAIVMYDVPPPSESIGIDASRKTWELFFRNTREFRRGRRGAHEGLGVEAPARKQAGAE